MQLVENVLPVEYYNELCGVMTDCAILSEKIENEIPDLYKFFNEKNMDVFLNNLIFKWMVSLFVENMHKDISLPILDALFLEGDVVLYKASLLILNLLKDTLLNCDSMDKLSKFLMEDITSFSSENFTELLFNPEYFKLPKKDINELRKIKSKKIIINIRRLKESEKKNERKLEGGDCNECNLDWPYCVKKMKEIDVGSVMKLSLIENPIIENDYFSQSHNIDKLTEFSIQQNQMIENNYRSNKEKYDTYVYGNILMTRCKHICGSKVSSRLETLGNYGRKSSLMKAFFDDCEQQSEKSRNINKTPNKDELFQ